MTDDSESTSEQQAPWPEPTLVSLEDVATVDVNAPIANIRFAECHELEDVYRKLAQDNVGNEPEFGVWRLMMGLCGLHFRVKDPAAAFGPQIVMGTRRSPIPSDWEGEQNEVLNAIYSQIKHPGLRARIADVVWINDRRKGAAARDAIDAYCDTVEGLRDGRFEERFDYKSTVSVEEMDLIERSIQISVLTSKRNSPLPNRIVSNITALYDMAREKAEPFPFKRMAGLMLRYDLLDRTTLAKDAEAVAISAAGGEDPYPLAIKECWDLAAAAHRDAGDLEEERRCLLEGVQQTLKMGNHVGQSSAKAHWVRTAISELRQISGTEEQREALRLEMRQLQEKSMDELSSFSIPVNFTEQISGTMAAFENLSLPEALKQFATIGFPHTPETLRQQALDSLQSDSISQMFGSLHHDHDGKVIAEVSGAPIDGVPDDDWIKHKIAELENWRRMEMVNGYIQAARQFLASGFPVSERHFQFIAMQSPFVPPSQAGIFALGFARFVQGDYISAAHMLIPQVENSIRYVLKNSNTDTSKILNDMLQEDRSLASLLESYRAELSRAFTPAVVMQIDLMFHGHPGPGLRHEMAHGRIATGQCFHQDVVYACWFIYQLTCIPLLGHWKDHVGPAIEAAAY